MNLPRTRHPAPRRARTMRLTVVTAMLAALALGAPGPAHAVDRDNRCLKWADRYRTVEQTRFAVLFSKPAGSNAPGSRLVYGCVFSVQRAYRLAGQDPLGPPEASVGTRALDGRYVAYGLERGDAGPVHPRVYVQDLKQGTVKVNVPALDVEELGENATVTAIVAKANGSTAWIVAATPDVHEVRKVEHGNEGESVLLERGGPEIGWRSLAKARDELRVYWTRGPEPRTAELE